MAPKVGSYKRLITAKDKKEFLRLLSEVMPQSVAAQKCGFSLDGFRRLRLRDKEFAEGWEDARRNAVLMAEDELIRRAMVGWEEPVFYKGEEVGKTRKYSDSALIFFLKYNWAEKYNPINKVAIDVSSQDGSLIPRPVQVADENQMSEIREIFKFLRNEAKEQNLSKETQH
jgi:hypothetical protein